MFYRNVTVHNKFIILASLPFFKFCQIFLFFFLQMAIKIEKSALKTSRCGKWIHR